MSRSSSRRPSAAAQRENRVRIIGGCWRGRKIAFPDAEGLRPTGDRIRETVFNWLQPVLPHAQCLDLFAGSGVLGFEALSRGAARCVMVERNPTVVQRLRDTQNMLAAAGAEIVAADSAQWLQTVNDRFDVVFIDPPFADAALSPAQLVSAMAQRNLLVADAWIYVEQAATTVSTTASTVPDGFIAFRQQRAGQVDYSIWRRAENFP